MAKWNSGIEVTFNDNDGKVGWRITPQAACDLERHWNIFGLWRTRWILFKRFWRGMMQLEVHAGRKIPNRKFRLWVFKPEIPE